MRSGSVSASHFSVLKYDWHFSLYQSKWSERKWKWEVKNISSSPPGEILPTLPTLPCYNGGALLLTHLPQHPSSSWSSGTRVTKCWQPLAAAKWQELARKRNGTSRGGLLTSWETTESCLLLAELLGKRASEAFNFYLASSSRSRPMGAVCLPEQPSASSSPAPSKDCSMLTGCRVV